jgi:hypothetical protein
MVAAASHYLLICDLCGPGGAATSGGSQASLGWRFRLESLPGALTLEAADSEPGSDDHRNALLSVVRGLEAIPEPAHVTLVTTNRYVARGLRYGLGEWQQNDFHWEYFGSWQPIRNADLWRRIAGALAFHQVQCRLVAESTAEPAMESAGRVQRSGSEADRIFDADEGLAPASAVPVAGRWGLLPTGRSIFTAVGRRLSGAAPRFARRQGAAPDPARCGRNVPSGRAIASLCS